jgi:tetrahydromethanopterin S-methyltransferase subunit G
MNTLFALALLQETTTDTVPVQQLSPAVGIGLGICYLVVVLLIIISLWKIFVKAGKPGWAAIVPIYNLIVLIEICCKPLWWFILLLIPFVNIIVIIILYVELSKRFGKGVGFAIGLLILPFIFFPVLAFSDAKYSPC